MKSNSLGALFSLFLWFSFSSGEIVKDYGNSLKLALSQDNVVLGEKIALKVTSYLSGVSYVYLELQSGESSFFNKGDQNNSWQLDYKIPTYLSEGITTFNINVVFVEQGSAKAEELHYLFKAHPEITQEEHANFVILKIPVCLALATPETQARGLTITLIPERVQPGQKFSVFVENPVLLRKSSVKYGGQLYPLKQESTLRWSAELIATKNSEMVVYLQKESGELLTEKRSILLVPTNKETEKDWLKNIVEKEITAAPQTKVPVQAQVSSFNIKGNKTIIFINKTKEGEIDSFKEEQRRDESLNLAITGQEGEVKVDAKVFSTTQENVDKKEDIRIKLYTHDWEAYLGDMEESTSGNQFYLKAKSLSGFKFSWYPQDKYFMFLQALDRGFEQEQYFYGNNSQGPFYLNGVPVVLGSERVYLNGILQQREKDYLIEYKSGKITFRQNIIQSNQLVRVFFEAENNDYRSKYTALRYVQDLGWLKIGLTGLAKVDPPNLSQTNQAPQDKKIYGLDLKMKYGYLGLDLEGARSNQITNTLEEHATVNYGLAKYAKLSYDDQRVLKFSSATKQTDDKFEPIGNKTLKRNLDGSDHYLELNSSNNFILRGEYQGEKYQDGADYHNINGYYKFLRAEDGLPQIHYWVKEVGREVKATNVTPNTLLQTYFWSENVDLSKSLTENFKLGIKGSRQRDEDNSTEFPFKDGESYGAYLKTAGLKSGDFTIGHDHQETNYRWSDRKVSINAVREESYTQLNLYPDNRFRLGSSFRDVQDTQEGDLQIAELNYILAPDYTLRTNGQYNVSALKESIVSQDYRVQKEKGSFALKYLPWPSVKTNFRYSPNVNIIKASRDQVSHFAEVKDYDLDYSIWSNLSFKYNYLNQYAYVKDIENDPDNLILRSEDLSHTDIYVLMLQPLEKLDLELKYRHTDIVDNDLNNTNTSNIFYTDGQGSEVEQGLTIYHRYNRDLLLVYDVATTGKEVKYVGAPSLNIEEQRDRYGIDAKYNLNRNWTFHLFGSSLRVENKLATENNITYEYAPGLGIAYRLVNLRISYDFTHIESQLGETILKRRHVLSTSYDFNNFINFTVNAEHINSERPYYKTTDVLAKFSATF